MIRNEERISRLSESKYKEIFGITKPTFDTMPEVLKRANAKERLKGGRKAAKMTILGRLVITLCYWREYRVYRNIAFDYGVSKSEIGKIILWVEDALKESGLFSLPSKRELAQNNQGRAALAIDVTEQQIERPKGGGKTYSGKKKCHTIKTLIVIDADSKEVLAIFNKAITLEQ